MPKVKTSEVIRMVVAESVWAQPPLKQDYRNAEKLLYDFGVVINIPKFNRYKDLQEWTSRQINQVLM